jgi:hypothetical protein
MSRVATSFTAEAVAGTSTAAHTRPQRRHDHMKLHAKKANMRRARHDAVSTKATQTRDISSLTLSLLQIQSKHEKAKTAKPCYLR